MNLESITNKIKENLEVKLLRASTDGITAKLYLEIDGKEKLYELDQLTEQNLIELIKKVKLEMSKK